MIASNHAPIREALKCRADGLTASQIARVIGKPADSARGALHSMPDCYIDRWNGPRRGQYEAVWCIVDVPENCPKPEGKKK